MAKINSRLVKQALTARLANRRQGTVHVKTRSEVSGGGRKPWRQKGTGRARAGSTRSPLWAGGGITFGPNKSRNYKKMLPKKMNRQAILELLKHLQTEGQLRVAESLALKEPKTKAAANLLGELGWAGKKILLITEGVEPELVIATNNLRSVTVTTCDNLSLLDLTVGEVVVDQRAAEKLGLKTTRTPGARASKDKSKNGKKQ